MNFLIPFLDWIVIDHEELSLIFQFQSILNTIPAKGERFMMIMISNNQMFDSVQLIKPSVFLSPHEVTTEDDFIKFIDNRIPSLDHLSVHFLNVFERTIGEFNDLSISKMQIRDDEFL